MPRYLLPLLLALTLSACATWRSPEGESTAPAGTTQADSTGAESRPGARAAPKATPRKPIFYNPPGTEEFSAALGFSQVVRAGNLVIVSGQVGFDPETGTFPDDFQRQVELAFDHLKLALRTAGARLSNVIEIQTYQLDMRRFNEVVKVRHAVFGRHHPTWTALGVDALADPNMQFEVRAVAWLPDTP